MMRYKCVVSYVGKNYSGWQSQRKGDSIQEILETVIERITQEKVNVIGSGRTDAGVNAKAQVFMFDTKREMPARKWMGAINAFLPNDIHIMSVEEEDDCFHARYNVRFKQYNYRINNGPYNVFTKDTAFQYPIHLDVEKMKEGIPYLVGTHDFTSLNSSSLEEYPDQVRTVRSITLTEEDGVITLAFVGKGFLRYMVRMMASVLIEVGKHKYEPSHIQEILDAKRKSFPHKNSPAEGLTLEYVDYFKTLALHETGMVREFLVGDNISCTNKELPALEQAIKENASHQFYAMTTRHSQELLGYYEINQGEASIHILEEERGISLANILLPQLEERLRKQANFKPILIYTKSGRIVSNSVEESK